jgi:plastocyanin
MRASETYFHTKRCRRVSRFAATISLRATLQLRIILIIIGIMMRITNRLSRIAIVALAAGLVGMTALSSSARADDALPQLKFAHGHFEPASFNVAAGTPIKLTVMNQGDSAIEFESFELNRERVVQPGETITVNLPKLDRGQYHFFDDFHHEVAQGTITAR